MNPHSFEVSIYGNLVPFEKNPLLSLARVRIFYKYLNRNRTFITDEFAEKLIKSLPYTPVSGIWEENDDDYTDHGDSREEGRIYGLVPENPNVSWEEHEDKDGVVRTYCCCDVVLFTSRYKHASDIVGKPQSMELYQKTLKGEWIIHEGVKCYRFTDGCFIGLQVLGEDVEPCFEGAAFYTYANSLKEMIDILKNYSLKEGDEQKMVINYKLSDRQKHDAIFALLNPAWNEEGDWVMDYCVCDVYDDYAVVYQYETGKYFRCPYIKNDETDSLEIGELTQVFIMDISAAELEALENLKAENNGNFSEIDSKYQSLVSTNSTLNTEKADNELTIASLNEKIEELNKTIGAGADTIASLNTQIEGLNVAAVDYQSTIDNLNTEISSLKEFKDNCDREEKKAEIAKYSMLEDEVVSKYTAEVDNYTLKELQDALKIEYVNANAKTIFSNVNNQPNNHYIPQVPETNVATGAAGLINKHKNNGGK